MDDVWLNTLRIARDCGDISSLFPEGIKRLWDLPFTIFNAIRFGLVYLSWEKLPEEEQPPRGIWENNDKLEAWFSEVKANRKLKAEGKGDMQSMPRNAAVEQMFGKRHGGRA